MAWDENTCSEVDCEQECCCNIPLPAELVLQFKNRIVNDPEKYKQLKSFPTDDPHVLPITEDLRCIFLNSNGRCTIYENRPEVCREYGKNEIVRCGYVDLNGNPRPPKERERVIQELNNETRQILGMPRTRSTDNKWF